MNEGLWTAQDEGKMPELMCSDQPQAPPQINNNSNGISKETHPVSEYDCGIEGILEWNPDT
jgi:hypothetical protein